MGDDVHVRTQAATNLLIRTWLPHLTELRDLTAGRSPASSRPTTCSS